MENRLNDIKQMVNAMDGDLKVTVFDIEMNPQALVSDFKWLIEQAEKVSKYEKAFEEIMKVNEKHEWNLYGLAYAIAERALLKK